jgi:hypothetical protein
LTRFALAFIISLLTANFVFSQQDTVISQPVFCPQGNWELVYSEAFDGDVLNKEQWITYFPYTDDGSDQCAFCRTHGIPSGAGTLIFDYRAWRWQQQYTLHQIARS